MRSLLAISLLAFLPFFAAGCTSDGTGDEPDKGKSSIGSSKELSAEKKRVLDLLRRFEEHDMAGMDDAVAELEEMSKAEEHLVSDEIVSQLKRYHDRATADSAIERLRWISRFARTIALLSRNTKEDWEHCRDLMIRLGPEAVVRFTSVLIVQYTTNPAWIRPMLMDLCVMQPAVVPDAILEGLAFEGTTQAGAIKIRVIDQTTRGGLVSTLVFLPDPPITKIRDSAVRAPAPSRQAWASVLAKPKAKDATTGSETSLAWAVELLGVQLASDPEWMVRAEAALALGETNDAERALPALTKALKDKDHWVRRNTCLSLGRFGARAKGAIGPMVEMLKGLDSETIEVEQDGKKVRRPFAGNPRRELEAAALSALKSLTGKTFQEVGSFIAWWEETNQK
ncbi:MAG: HEAT repeat domain-containing protein [Planctomycetes bacterium]|nr:HEAT repeat domain-containing protein [Planctomycetota bacterium]